MATAGSGEEPATWLPNLAGVAVGPAEVRHGMQVVFAESEDRPAPGAFRVGGRCPGSVPSVASALGPPFEACWCWLQRQMGRKYFMS